MNRNLKEDGIMSKRRSPVGITGASASLALTVLLAIASSVRAAPQTSIGEVNSVGIGFNLPAARLHVRAGAFSPPAAQIDPRWLHRVYPGDSCAGLCSEQNEGYWDDGVNLGYNFFATNCVDNQHTFNYSEVHSPMPTWVLHGTTPGVPDYGTFAFPITDDVGSLNSAYWGSTPGTHLMINGLFGNYVICNPGILLPDCSESTKLNKAMRLEGYSGNVKIMGS